MYAMIHKWGNSQAIRLSKAILENAGLRENDKVEINAEKDCIIIRRMNRRHKTIQERFSGFSGGYECEEWDTGSPDGNEVW